jgi:hypothetical protein
MNRSMRLLAALAVALFPLVASSMPPVASRPEFGIYCVQGRLAVEQKRIEELKRVYGGDVCRLDQDASANGAFQKVQRLGGPGAGCSCEM